jgi:hypothetical protein
MVATTTLSMWSNGGAAAQQPLLEESAEPRQEPRATKTLAAAAWSLTNMLSSVTIVLINKLIFKAYDFRFPLALCCIHTCVTALGLRATAAWPGALRQKEVPLLSKVYMGFCYAAFVASSVLSIQLNPIGERPGHGSMLIKMPLLALRPAQPSPAASSAQTTERPRPAPQASTRSRAP